MTKQSLTFSGWLAFVYAATEIPILVLYVFAQDFAGVVGGKFIEAALNVVCLALFILLSLRIKNFLNQQFGFHQIDALVRAMIVVNSFSISVNLIAIIFKPLETVSLVISIISLIASGIIGMVFSINLLQLSNDLYGLLKPYAYTYLVACALTATVILIPFGLVAGIVSTILMGIIFLKAAAQQSF